MLWRDRFAQQGLPSLWEIAPGRGRKASYDSETIQQIIDTTLQSKPRGGTQWSCRSLAQHLGVSKSTVNNVWRSHNLKPHRVKTSHRRKEPNSSFRSYPARLAYEEGALWNDDARLQAPRDDFSVRGLELAQGKVVGECYQRHRHQEFLSFLRRLDQEFPGQVPLHLVMDNYGTHKKDEVQTWLKKHPRFVLHFVPTSSSWLNLVERWFSELSRQCIRRGAFFSVGDLKKAIREFLAAWNEDPQPFVWTATVESIMGKLSRCRQTLEKIQPGCTLPLSRKKEQ